MVSFVIALLLLLIFVALCFQCCWSYWAASAPVEPPLRVAFLPALLHYLSDVPYVSDPHRFAVNRTATLNTVVLWLGQAIQTGTTNNSMQSHVSGDMLDCWCFPVPRRNKHTAVAHRLLNYVGSWTRNFVVSVISIAIALSVSQGLLHELYAF